MIKPRKHEQLPHQYLSTACLHGEHDYCNSTEGHAGPKRPGRCKFCDALCTCQVCQHIEVTIPEGGVRSGQWRHQQ